MDKIPHPELDKEDHGSPKEELINRSDFICPQHQIKTPTTSNEVLTLRKQIEDDLIRNGLLNTPCKLRIRKLANGAEMRLQIGLFYVTKTIFYLNRIMSLMYGEVQNQLYKVLLRLWLMKISWR
jgi:hypothetical protein